MDMQSMVSPWAEQLGQQTAGQIRGGMRQGATPMPQDLFGAMMGAYQMPSFGQGPMQYLNQMYGGGMPWQPQQFNPMDFYQSIYGQQQQAAPTMPRGKYATPA
jgi:hypothetical protein